MSSTASSSVFGSRRLFQFLAEDDQVEVDAQANYGNFDTIDWVRDFISDGLSRESVDQRPKTFVNYLYKQYYRFQGWIYVILIGILSALIAALVDLGVDFFTDIRMGFCKGQFLLSKSVCCIDSISYEECDPWVTWQDALGSHGYWTGLLVDSFFYISLATLFAAMSAWLVKALSPWAAGSGIPEMKTILGGFVIHMFNSPQTLVVKTVGLILSVSSGLNLGKEGPMVHISSCVAQTLSPLFPKYRRNEGKMREILSAAAAAGVSIAFGAPIGGVLFSLEEVSYYFPHKTLWRSFLCASVAALSLRLIDPYHTGKIILFEASYTHMWSFYELGIFIAVGCICGALGALFVRLNVLVCKFRKSTGLKHYPVREAAVLAFVTALTSFLNAFLLGNTGELIGTLFRECDSDRQSSLCDPEKAAANILNLGLAMVTRFVLTVFTFGLKIPAGLFIPSLAIGASLGRAVGILVQVFESNFPESAMFFNCSVDSSLCVSPGVYAIVGAAGMLCGVTRMTVSLVVIMFELTGNVNYIVPLMATVITSKWCGDAFGKDGIYDEHIVLNKYPFLDNKADYKFSSVLSAVMRKGSDLILLEANAPNTILSLKSFLCVHHFTGFPVVTSIEDMAFVGYIARSELRLALERAAECGLPNSTPCFFTHDPRLAEGFDLRPWMDAAPICLYPTTKLGVVHDIFKKLGLRYCMASYQGKLVGFLTKKDFLQHIAVKFKHTSRHFRHTDDAQ